MALPFSKLYPRSINDDDIDVDATLRQLQEATRLNREKLADFTQPRVATAIYDHYQIPKPQRLESGNTGRNDQGSQHRGAARDGGADNHVLISRDVIATILPGMSGADKVIGAQVALGGDRGTGEIDEILIDSDSDAVAYILVSHGGFLGIGNEWHPLPIQSLQWDSKSEKYRVATPTDGSGISSMSIKDGDPPRRVRQSELDQLYSSYGIPPDRTEKTERLFDG